MIRQIVLFVIVRDIENKLQPNRVFLEYKGAILNIIRMRRGGQAHPIYRMIEVESFSNYILLNPKTLERIHCYNIQSIHQSAHMVPTKIRSDASIWYVNNYID